MDVLVANRGEIAVRVIRACREMGLGAIAVYSDCDRDALHVRLADAAYHIGAAAPAESYLNIDRIISVAKRAGASLVHPGYGFLAENEEFAQACADAGLTFVGPSPDAIALMGSKTAARQAAIAADVPVVPGLEAPFEEDAPDARSGCATRIGYPLVVKAVAGGGGKGMRTVKAPEDLLPAIRTARSEAGSAFGDTAVYFERRLARPRHVEIQLMGDHHGTVLPFVERECSIQRRHQKVVEESPSPVLEPGTRHRMAECAARVARAVGYTNAGTIEFLLDEDGRFYFLEMNTRLQVEHPVTEMVTGVDLVHWQLRIARGEKLTVPPEQALTPRAHAIECRIYAEDPDLGFMPSPGLVRALSVPGGPGVRDDRGVAAGFEIPMAYDSMISKLVVWAATRPEAIERLRRALAEYRVVASRRRCRSFSGWCVSRFAEGTVLDVSGRHLAERKGSRLWCRPRPTSRTRWRRPLRPDAVPARHPPRATATVQGGGTEGSGDVRDRSRRAAAHRLGGGPKRKRQAAASAARRRHARRGRVAHH
jgi:acetyl-CoA carboxylase biotin carboxylase subunit